MARKHAAETGEKTDSEVIAQIWGDMDLGDTEGFKEVAGGAAKSLANGEIVRGIYRALQLRPAGKRNAQPGEAGKTFMVHVLEQDDGSMRNVGGAAILNSHVAQAALEHGGSLVGKYVIMARAPEDLPAEKGKNGAGVYKVLVRES